MYNSRHLIRIRSSTIFSPWIGDPSASLWISQLLHCNRNFGCPSLPACHTMGLAGQPIGPTRLPKTLILFYPLGRVLSFRRSDPRKVQVGRCRTCVAHMRQRRGRWISHTLWLREKARECFGFKPRQTCHASVGRMWFVAATAVCITLLFLHDLLKRKRSDFIGEITKYIRSKYKIHFLDKRLQDPNFIN